MNTLREAAQQALEALEYYRSGEDYQPTPASAAITALRAALAEPEELRENERLREAVAAEREACAMVAEEKTAAWTEYDYNSACMDCAKAIRARGKS